MSTVEPAVAVEGLRIVLRDTEIDIVDEVSFTIAPGEVLGLVGESGSGKTTVGLALLGHTRRGAAIAGGSIRVGDADILSLSNAGRRSIRGRVVSYVPQDPAASLNPALRIGTQLRETLDVHGFGSSSDERDARIAEVMREVALPDDKRYLRRYPHELSGGQQQRIGLAMAFACRPAPDRARRADDRPRRDDAGARARHRARTCGRAPRGCPLRQPRPRRGRHARHPHGRHVRRADRRDRPDRRAVRVRLASLHAPARTGDPAPLGAPRPRRDPRAGTVAGREAERLHIRTALHVRAGRLPRRGSAAARASPSWVKCLRAEEVRASAVSRSERLDEHVAQEDVADAVLSLDHVFAGYGATTVVHDINLQLAPHECLALVGESGSGKTTLARSIAGLHRDRSGLISLRGEPLADAARSRTRAARQSIQYVFQNPYGSLNPRKTIGQIVRQPLGVFGTATGAEADKRVDEMLDRVSLAASYVDRYPDQLSGGERQRVAIARALVVSPSVLVCDEVTSALDVSVQAAIVELLAELQRELGLAMLFVTHNLPLVRSIAQRVAVMSAGRIVELGTVERVLHEPSDDYTQRLLADTPSLETAIA